MKSGAAPEILEIIEIIDDDVDLRDGRYTTHDAAPMSVAAGSVPLPLSRSSQ